MKYVVSPITPIATRWGVSHRAGWACYWAQELGAKLVTSSWKDFAPRNGDEVFLYHGMEFNGSLNLPSGLTDDIIDRAKRLQSWCNHTKVYSCDIAMPPYVDLLARRGVSIGQLSPIKLVRWPRPNPNELIIGDSHALSMYRPGARIIRIDGQTLHGALTTNLISKIAVPSSVKYVTIYLGNIDIRHHLLRQPKPLGAVAELADQLADQLARLRLPRLTLVAPLPIETEARRLPKTGWYKGTPFYGEWGERDHIRQALTAQLKVVAHRLGAMLYQHPTRFLNSSGQLSEDVMEKPGSVHLRPDQYRLCLEGQSWTVG